MLRLFVPLRAFLRGLLFTCFVDQATVGKSGVQLLIKVVDGDSNCFAPVFQVDWVQATLATFISAYVDLSRAKSRRQFDLRNASYLPRSSEDVEQ